MFEYIKNLLFLILKIVCKHQIIKKASKKTNGKNVDIKAEKEGKREKSKKRTRKSFTKGREDGNINGHSTRETSERTLKTEQERIKHNVNESLEINRKQKKS